ncbi:IBR domain containing protein [Sarcoptes scabiei]|nr:IBR domain containing protein [Sarcoptes scabiei]
MEIQDALELARDLSVEEEKEIEDNCLPIKRLKLDHRTDSVSKEEIDKNLNNSDPDLNFHDEKLLKNDEIISNDAINVDVVANPYAIDDDKSEEGEISLDEGEIIDDDDDNNGRNELVVATEKIKSSSSTLRNSEEEKMMHQQQNSKFSEQNSFTNSSNCNENIDQNETKIDQNDENFEEGEYDDRRSNNELFDDMMNADEINSNYSDWSETKDDLLEADLVIDQSKSNNRSDSIQAQNGNIKNEIDLEVISDEECETNEPETNSLDESNQEFENLLSQKAPDDDDDDDEKEPEKIEVNILDSLKIDWKSLLEHSRQEQNETTSDPNDIEKKKLISETFRKKYSTIAMLNRIGFSYRYAGAELSKLIENQMQEQLQEDYQPMLSKIASMHSFQLSRKSQAASILSNGPMNGQKDKKFFQLASETFL